MSKLSCPSLNQNVAEGKLTIVDCRKGFDEKIKLMHIEP